MTLRISVDEIVGHSKNPLLAIGPGWRRVRLGEIASMLNGCAFKSTQFKKGEGMPLIRIRDVGRDSTDTNYVGDFDEQYVIEPGALLIGMDGDFNCARWKGPRGLLNQRVCKVTLYRAEYHPRFLDYALPGYLKAINDATSSVTVKHLSSRTVGEIPLPFPSRTVQEQIVIELDKQFSRLDEAVDNLNRIKANLRRYRAAVLKAAVEGKLTEEWRKAHPDVESASRLLERILVERRTQGNENAQYKEPSGQEASSLPRLPGRWVWARLGGIAALKGGITVDKNRKSPNARMVPYLRVANVQRGYLDLSEIKEILAPVEDIVELHLKPGDILFTEGGDRDKLGRGWVWEGQLPECIHQNHVFRARLYSGDVSARFVSWWGNSFGQLYFLREGKQTTNLASLNMTKLSAFPVPLPPAEEQKVIAQEVERRLSVIEDMEAAVEANLKRGDGLRQAILNEAFSGRLVKDVLWDPMGGEGALPVAAESPTAYRAVSK